MMAVSAAKTMFAYPESTEFRSSRAGYDRGFFTVQSTDVPAGPTRRKKIRGNHKAFWRTIRLAPITENEERLWEPADSPCSEDFETSVTPSSVDGRTARPNSGSKDNFVDKSVTYETVRRMPRRKSDVPSLHLELDTFEEELQNIPEDCRTPDTEVQNMLTKLPPRPKCKRKVLPPSVTKSEPPQRGQSTNKSNKLLKLRAKIQNNTQTNSVSSSNSVVKKKDRKTVHENKAFNILDHIRRPQSADNEVHVIKLSDLGSLSSRSSVPDLPTLIDSIVKHNELTASYAQTQERSNSSPKRENSFEDSGALSTPRPDSKTPTALRGSDISSFYHVWDRNSKRRPFDRKDAEKSRVKLNRDCMCSVQNQAKGNKCGVHRSHVLPPIGAARKEAFT